VNFKRTAALVATTTTVLAAAGCGVNPGATQVGLNKVGTYNAAAKRSREKGGNWTVLIHMAAENNLYRFGLEDLNEMEAGLPEGSDVNVYVLFDGIKNGDSCIYHVKRDSGMNGNIISEKVNAPEVIPASNEIDSGDVKVATKFVEWAAKNAPADHTFLGYWDHGSGLFQGGPHPITKGFGWDDNGSHMNTWDLTTIAGAFHAASGKALAGVGFDACLMGHVEIGYQLKGNAEYLVASEELEPGKGWDYQGWLKRVGASDKTPAAVASALVESYGASYQPGGSQSSGRDQATLTATDVTALNANVVPAIEAFVAAAKGNMGSDKAAFQAARSKAQTFYNKDCADLGSFLANLNSTTKNQQVLSAAAALTNAYKAAVVKETHTKDFPGATGLVMYFPTPQQRINPVYNDPSKIAFGGTSWKDFLNNYR
jgi:hypothetical protein